MRLLKTLCILTTFFCVFSANATIIVVENVNDAGPGSLRDAVADASLGANDTILINVRGTISLDSPIEFDSFTALTVIGPYAKHNRITAGGIWTGSLFNITNSGGIIFLNLGFNDGNGNTRHATIQNCADEIIFERCIFQNNDLTLGGARGGSVEVIASSATFSQCSFINNQAVSDGGAMALRGNSNLSLTNCTFSGNESGGSSGAIYLSGSSFTTMHFNTFVHNIAAMAPEAIGANPSTDVIIGNNAIGDNGTGQQIELNGLVITDGRNKIKKNFPGEVDNLPGAVVGDEESTAVVLGLRATILEDGFGLKYWPIVDDASDLINPASPGVTVPDNDIRNAPRALKGPSPTDAYPDAGACEYTHLRVTSDASGVSSGTFLGAISTLPKDAIHYIEFDISGPGIISLDAVGSVTGGTYIIDGFSQPLSAIPGPHFIDTSGLTPPNLPIDFDNAGAVNVGIKFEAGSNGSTVQGVRTQGFNFCGIEAALTADNISIFGCESGIDASGNENGNGQVGLRLNSNGNTIGGWEHWMRNTSSGNGLAGVEEANIRILFLRNSNIIMGNIIGGSPDGMGPIGGAASQTPYGILVQSRFNIIGGTLPNSNNIIIDNEYGTYHNLTGDYNIYSGNLIGLAWDESTAVGNSIAGISFNGADDNLVGGYATENQNRIAHNGSGIELAFATTTARRNTILGNAIYSNDEQGIDINNDDVVLANDGLFDGSNSNQGIDFPEISESTSCGGGTSITTYDLRVPVSQDYRVEFFTVSSPDATNGEGETFVGAATVSVTSNPQTFTFDHGFDLGLGVNITATATQISSGNTSEFGGNVLTIAAAGDPSISYDDICPWEIASPNFDGDTGGEFRFSDPAPADGATIDMVSGEITGAIEGTTYEVIYGFSGSCTVEDTTTFSVHVIDENFVFPDFCAGSNGMPSSVETPGGVFSLNPDFGDGASINAVTGILTGGIEGTTYTVQYIADDGSCIDTGTVDVLVTGVDESFTMADICPEVESAAAVPVTAGGDFSFAPDPGDGATINTITGAITGGVEGSTYMISYVVGTCIEEDIVAVNVIATDESFVFDDFCPDEVGSPSAVVIPGGFSFLVDPADGATIDAATGDITFGVEGTTYEVLHTVGTCADKDTAYPTVITVNEAFTFADFCINGDSSSTAPIAVDPANSNYILFAPADGASINPITGIIYDPIEGTTYTIVDSVSALGCWQADTVMVTPLNVDESFTMADICPEVESAAAVPVTAGGDFSFAPDPGDGATINTITGAITGGVEGSIYMVRYVVGPCAEEHIIAVNVTEADESFVFEDFCPDEVGSPSAVVIPGGFSFLVDPADGATIDAATGDITFGVEGTTYEVLHTVGTCADKDTAYPTVITVNEAFTFADFCINGDSSSTAPIAADPANSNYILFGPLDGASINPTTGIIYDPFEGTTYTIVDSVSALGCWQADTVMVTPLNVDESFTMADICPEIESTAAVPITAGGDFSFAPDPGDGATINTITGAITGGVEGSIYMVSYVVGPCAEEHIIAVNVTAADESFVFNDFCPETTGSPTFVAESGEFSFLTPPIDGALIDETTGDITGGTEGTTYEVVHTVGTCLDKDTLYPMMVEVLEGFIFPDFCEVNNISAILPTAEDPVNSYYILLGPDDGAYIDEISGRIHDPIEGTTYTVVDSVWVSGCWQADTTDVLTILVDEYFEYDVICVDGSGFPTDVELGGVFSIVDDPLDGTTIDAASGELLGGTEGTTYTIRYIKDTGLCADTLEQEVLFVDTDASFEFPDFCPGLNPSPSPTSLHGPGIFDFATAPGDGATIDPDSGFINDPVEGNSYEIMHTYIDLSTSCTDTKIETVNVKVVNEAVSYENFCWEEASGAAEVFEADGIFTFGTPAPIDEAILDAFGSITGATEGTVYEIVHTVTVDGCEQSDSTFVTALGVDESFIFEDYCSGGDSPAPTATTPGGFYEFFGDVDPDVTIDPLTGVISGGVEGEFYYVMYSVNDTSLTCIESSIEIVWVLGSDESFSMDNFCAKFASNSPDPEVEGGTYTFDPDLGDGALIDPATGIITSAIPGTTYGVMYTLITGICTESETNTVVAYGSDTADFSIENYCANISTPIDITGTPGGEFSFNPSPAPDGATIDGSSGIINGSIGGTYDVTYMTLGDDTTCADTITKLLTLYDIPVILELTSDNDSYCPAEVIDPMIVSESFATSQVYWYIEDIGGTIADSTFAYTPSSLNVGDNVFYAQPKSDQGCYGEFVLYELYLSDTAGMGVISDFQICKGSPAYLEAYGGSSYKWHTNVPLSDYTNPIQMDAFSIMEENYVVSIFNDDGCEVIDSIKVTFSPRNECAINVYNAFSPNGDGKNDFWYIDNLINYVPNAVYIYNRWGDEVQMITDYDNITPSKYWDGNDKNGNELPPGTYFYVVITDDPSQSQAAWVQLVR